MTRIYLFFLIVLVLDSAFAIENVPDNTKAHQVETRIRYFYPVEKYSLFSEVQLANHSGARDTKSVLLGAYYRYLDIFRFGLFYQRQYGIRHNEDWFKDTISGWQWRDTTQRGEDLAIFDYSVKTLMNGHENITVDIKLRYEYNFFNKNQSIRGRGGFSFFNLVDDEPKSSFFLHYEFVRPLNYSNYRSNETWAYLGGLYHDDSHFQFGGYLARRWQAWFSTSEYTSLTGKTYMVDETTDVLGITAIFKN